VTTNPVQLSDLPKLIADVSATLAGLAQKRVEKPEPKKPTIAIKKTVTPDHIISLEDGKPYKMLRSHLTRLGLNTRPVPRKMGPSGQLPDDSAKLRCPPLGDGEEDAVGAQRPANLVNLKNTKDYLND
jgi:hypothetical protein